LVDDYGIVYFNINCITYKITQMKKEQILGLVRQVATIVFTVLAAKWFQDGDNAQAIVASVVGAVATIWGIVDKTSKGLSAWASAARHIVSIVAGLVFALAPGNKVLIDIIASILAVLTALSSAQANSKK
jgi:uncharacterized membrane protein HdeD (DUF308 family)